MYKNQLQEIAQSNRYILPSYSCRKDGPDHAPRYKGSVTFNGERFQSRRFCSTVKEAEQAAAEFTLNALISRDTDLGHTGMYKNLLQHTSHAAGIAQPKYTTTSSGPDHEKTFVCTVEVGGMHFTGRPAKTKKQAEKNAAVVAWCSMRVAEE